MAVLQITQNTIVEDCCSPMHVLMKCCCHAVQLYRPSNSHEPFRRHHMHSIDMTHCCWGWVSRVVCELGTQYTRSSAIAEGPHDASCQLKSCQLPCRNYLYKKSRTNRSDEVGGLEAMCKKHVHSTTTRSSLFHCPIVVINKLTYGRVVDITCTPTTCCGEIF